MVNFYLDHDTPGPVKSQCSSSLTLSFLLMHTVTIALHKDCGVADQLKAALVVEILNYVTKYKDFAPVGCSNPSPQFRVLVDWFLVSRSPLEWICHLWQQ